MLTRLSALLQHAAEFSSQILTTDNSTQDEFKDHWKTVTNALTDPNGSIQLLKTKLKSMVELLRAEEDFINPADPGTVGPCLEFVLRHKVLDTLFTMARSDYPVGMAQLVLAFFTDILSQLDRPLLHHVSIHQPIMLQVSCCGENPSSPLSLDQVQFLHSICGRLNKDPRVADFFMKDAERTPQKRFVVSESLLLLTNCSNSIVVIKSYECLLMCASLQHSSVTAALSASLLPMILASKLQYHLQLIPSTTSYSNILTCRSEWMSDYSEHCLSKCPSSSDSSHVMGLFSWLDYCDQMITISQPSLGEAICESIREVFLNASLLPKILKSKEEEILISTSVLARAVQVVHSKKLLEEFVEFALESSHDQPDNLESPITTVMDKLVYRIDHINEDVCQATLQFFDILLSSPFLALVIRHLTNCQSVVQHYILQAAKMHLVRIQLEEDIVSYLSLVPYCIENDGYEMEQYISESRDKVVKSMERCSDCIDHLISSKTEGATNSLFLLTLLNKLETLLDQPYEINLLVTSIFNKLASIPYPTLQWLFTTHSKERNVYTVLKKVADTFQVRMERTPGLLVHRVEARRRLAGQPTSDILSMPHNNLLEGSIVLEEFIKELSSVIYTKTSWSILALPPVNNN